MAVDGLRRDPETLWRRGIGNPCSEYEPAVRSVSGRLSTEVQRHGAAAQRSSRSHVRRKWSPTSRRIARSSLPRSVLLGHCIVSARSDRRAIAERRLRSNRDTGSGSRFDRATERPRVHASYPTLSANDADSRRLRRHPSSRRVVRRLPSSRPPLLVTRSVRATMRIVTTLPRRPRPSPRSVASRSASPTNATTRRRPRQRPPSPDRESMPRARAARSISRYSRPPTPRTASTT